MKSGSTGYNVPEVVKPESKLEDVISQPLEKVLTYEEMDDKAKRLHLIDLLRKAPTDKEIQDTTLEESDIPGGLAGHFKLARIEGRRQDNYQDIILRGFQTHVLDLKQERIEGSKRVIKFEEGCMLGIHATSLVAVRALLHHPGFGKVFIIDSNDPGYLWRRLGLVTEKKVVVVDRVANVGDVKKILNPEMA